MGVEEVTNVNFHHSNCLCAKAEREQTQLSRGVSRDQLLVFIVPLVPFPFDSLLSTSILLMKAFSVDSLADFAIDRSLCRQEIWMVPVTGVFHNLHA